MVDSTSEMKSRIDSPDSPLKELAWWYSKSTWRVPATAEAAEVTAGTESEELAISEERSGYSGAGEAGEEADGVGSEVGGGEGRGCWLPRAARLWKDSAIEFKGFRGDLRGLGAISRLGGIRTRTVKTQHGHEQ